MHLQMLAQSRTLKYINRRFKKLKTFIAISVTRSLSPSPPCALNRFSRNFSRFVSLLSSFSLAKRYRIRSSSSPFLSPCCFSIFLLIFISANCFIFDTHRYTHQNRCQRNSCFNNKNTREERKTLYFFIRIECVRRSCAPAREVDRRFCFVGLFTISCTHFSSVSVI